MTVSDQTQLMYQYYLLESSEGFATKSRYSAIYF